MNYLAHLFLSPRTPLLLAGALAGDVVHGRIDSAAPPELHEGIALHRTIDAFADSHPAFGESRRRLGEYRHYARVIVDVFYDHLLARAFDEYSSESLHVFAAQTYRELAAAQSGIAPLERMIARMREHDWLSGYGEIVNVRRALHYLSRRFSRPVSLEESVETLEAEREAFTNDFRRFFPDLLRHVRAQLPANQTLAHVRELG